MNETNNKVTQEGIDEFCKGTFVEMLNETQQMEIKAMFAAYGRTLSESQAPEPHTEVTASARELAYQIVKSFESHTFECDAAEKCGRLIEAFAKQYAERENALRTQDADRILEAHESGIAKEEMLVDRLDQMINKIAALSSPSEPVGVLLDVEKALQQAIDMAGLHSFDAGGVSGVRTANHFWGPDRNHPELAAYLRAQQAPKGSVSDV